MTIAEARDTCKRALERIPRDVLVVTALVLASSAGFGLGYLTGQGAGKGSDIWIEVVPPPVAGVAAETAPPATRARTPDDTPPQVGAYVASKNGTKYYLPSCAGAKRISNANRVWFASVAAAQAAGYAPAANCPGL